MLDAGSPLAQCRECGTQYPQSGRWLDLRPLEIRDREPAGWRLRQDEMERAYRELAADPAHTRLAYTNDFGPYADLLARCRGRVLDLGGGNGIVRHFLPAGCEYLSIDPSVAWLDWEWAALSNAFPCLAEPLVFVRAFGESLPFATASMDHALSFWSLNHSIDPRRVLAELARVLAPGGRLLVSLDDVAPSWRDVRRGAYRDRRWPTRASLIRQKLVSMVAGWPTEPDHLAIVERDLTRWCDGRFALASRSWVGTYLTLDLRRRLAGG